MVFEMTIQKAIDSGRHFRRKGWVLWAEVGELDGEFTLLDTSMGYYIPFALEDLLADDWEISKSRRNAKRDVQ
jgi:hypothetical protein